MAQIIRNPPTVQEPRVRCLGREDPLERGMATHSWVVFLPGESPRTEEPVGLQSMASQSWTGLSDCNTHI